MQLSGISSGVTGSLEDCLANSAGMKSEPCVELYLTQVVQGPSAGPPSYSGVYRSATHNSTSFPGSAESSISGRKVETTNFFARSLQLFQELTIMYVTTPGHEPTESIRSVIRVFEPTERAGSVAAQVTTLRSLHVSCGHHRPPGTKKQDHIRDPTLTTLRIGIES